MDHSVYVEGHSGDVLYEIHFGIVCELLEYK